MGNTPKPPKGENVDSMTFPVPAPPAGTVYKGTPKASYTPVGVQDPFGYGKTGGKSNLQTGNVPAVQVGGGSEVGTLPEAFNGNFGVGDDKNVSTPVSG